MKNGYRVILLCLAVLGVVYASAEPKKKAEDEKERDWPCSDGEEVKYKPIELCKFPVSMEMEVGHYVQIKGCYKRKIMLVQVDCGSIGKGWGDFPCYKGSDVIKVRSNFPAILNASINKSSGDVEMLKEVNLYWENGVNKIHGTSGWEELTLCFEAWNVDLYKFRIGALKVGEITIDVRVPDITLFDKAPMPRSSILVRPDVASEDFVGTWIGQTTNKPDEGNTAETMELHVMEPSESDWKASVSGTFPSDGEQEVGQIQLVENKIGFYMQAMDGKVVVWLGLHPREDDKLIGESFALDPDCDGRNIGLIRKKEK